MSDPRIAVTGDNPKKVQPLHTGLLSGITGIGKNLIALFFSRVELAAFELAEARQHLLLLAITGALALMALWFAVAYWSVLVVLVNWDTMGWKILAIVAGFFSLVAVGLALYARAMLQNGRLAMPETLAELRKDRDALLS